MIKSITHVLIILFIFQQLKSQISQIYQNGYNAVCDETLHLSTTDSVTLVILQSNEIAWHLDGSTLDSLLWIGMTVAVFHCPGNTPCEKQKSNPDLDYLISNMNSQLTKLHYWMSANKLILNVDKTNFMIFGTRHINNNTLHLYYNNQAINRVSSTKFLGVVIYR